MTIYNDGFFTNKKIGDGRLYYDVGHLYEVSAVVLLKGNVGSVLFDGSIDRWLQFTQQREKGIKKIRLKRRPTIYSTNSNGFPFNRFVAIHDAEKVLYIVDELRQERINLKDKIGVNL